MSDLLIGADPEFFLKDPDGKFVSAHDKLPGDKKKPYKVKKGAVQVDGVACEFNIDPAATPEEFADNIETVLQEVRKMIPSKYSFDFTPAVMIPKDIFEDIPNQHKELGCDPDLNVYLKGFNKVPKDNLMRTGSGHLHLGWGNDLDVKSLEHAQDCAAMVYALDANLSYIRYLWDMDEKRQTMYGSNGSYRIKPYGVEYRVLSNAWLKYPDLWTSLFKITKSIYMKLLETGTYNHSYNYKTSYGSTRQLHWELHADYQFNDVPKTISKFLGKERSM